MEEIVFDPDYFQPILERVVKNYEEFFAQDFFEQKTVRKLPL